VDSGPHQTGSARRFRFLRCIGKGGFGEVYLAEMSTSSGFVKTVAVKVLREDVQEHEQVASRLRDEARLLGMMSHRSIVQADDLITLAGRPAVVMEYVPGVNFSWIINPKRCETSIPPGVVLYTVRQVADALDVAYSRPSTVTGSPLKVLHRDIKPANIRLTPDGEVKVLDFGIARADNAEREAHTQNYQLGSLRYMSPELMGGSQASPASDVYALGVVSFEALARRRLGWAGESEEIHSAQIRSRLEEADLTAFPGESWNIVVELLQRMLDFDPAKRPTAQEVMETCRALEQQVGGPAAELWIREILPQVKIPEDPKDADLTGQTLFEEGTDPAGIPDEVEVLELDSGDIVPDNQITRRRGRLWLVPVVGLLALVMLIVVGGAGFWLLRSSGFGSSAELAEPATGAEQSRAQAEQPGAAEERRSADQQAAGQQAEAEQAAQDDAEQDPSGEPAKDPSSAEGALAADEPGTDEPSSSEPGAADPAGDAPAVADAPGSTAAEAGEQDAQEEPHRPEPESVVAPSGDPIKVRFASVPFGIEVYVDGKSRGKTPLSVKLEPGPHAIMYLAGEKTVRQTIEVVEGGQSLWSYSQTKGSIQ